MSLVGYPKLLGSVRILVTEFELHLTGNSTLLGFRQYCFAIARQPNLYGESLENYHHKKDN